MKKTLYFMCCVSLGAYVYGMQREPCGVEGNNFFKVDDAIYLPRDATSWKAIAAASYNGDDKRYNYVLSKFYALERNIVIDWDPVENKGTIRGVRLPYKYANITVDITVHLKNDILFLEYTVREGEVVVKTISRGEPLYYNEAIQDCYGTLGKVFAIIGAMIVDYEQRTAY